MSEALGGVTTNYLVDTVNPTGYAQVVDELQSGTVTRTYAYGLDLLPRFRTKLSMILSKERGRVYVEEQSYGGADRGAETGEQVNHLSASRNGQRQAARWKGCTRLKSR